MRKISVPIFVFGLLLLIGCCSRLNNTINSITVSESQGVGPNAFVFIMKINDSDLMEILKRCEGEFIFSPPLEELSTSSIRCFTMSEQEAHIKVISTLWSDLSSEEIREKELNININKVTLKIIDNQKNSWIINN